MSQRAKRRSDDLRPPAENSESCYHSSQKHRGRLPRVGHRSRNPEDMTDQGGSGHYDAKFLPKGRRHKKEQTRELCRYWSVHGHCRSLPHCRFLHDIRLITSQFKAHARGIYDVYSLPRLANVEANRPSDCPPQQSVVIIFTASQDKTVKKWILYSAGTTERASQPPKLKLFLAQKYDLEAPCLSVYYSHDCLVCGLNNGNLIIIESQTNQQITLVGHEGEVHCVRFIDGLLVSGDWKGYLKFWKPDPAQRTFVDTFTTQVPDPITCFVEVGQPNLRHLWIGCTGVIHIFDLVKLTLLHSIRLTRTQPGTSQVVMSLLVVEEHVICCTLDGSIKVYNSCTWADVSGDHQSLATKSTQNYCSMAGSMSEDGPVLICGKQHGIVSVIGLPDFRERFFFKCHASDVRAVHNLGGCPSYFVTTAFDGSMSVWTWKKPTSNQQMMREAADL